MVTDLVSCHVGSHRGDDSGEIHTELWRDPVDSGVSTERDQGIGEVDAGRGDRDLNLSRFRRNPYRAVARPRR
jgi:hypothetical protein